MFASDLIEELQKQIDAGNGDCDLLVCFSVFENPVEISSVEFDQDKGIVINTL